MICTRVAIAGISSEVGKTTLLCKLLRKFPGWEAIKMTRGHYRSCGKDPHACCVSNLLGDEPLIRSGFQQTYASGKDTGKYWDAGAANVHWVIVTEDQVERGIQLALERIKAPGVLIEGNSFLRFIDVDFTVLVASDAPVETSPRVKGSTRWALQKASALYVPDRTERTNHSNEILTRLNSRFAALGPRNNVPVYAAKDFPRLVTRINTIHSGRTGAHENHKFQREVV
jgi:molybdopterin-guanine dinucleotide biosynthesis protein